MNKLILKIRKFLCSEGFHVYFENPNVPGNKKIRCKHCDIKTGYSSISLVAFNKILNHRDKMNELTQSRVILIEKVSEATKNLNYYLDDKNWTRFE